jgi:hypothetical protein
MARRRVWLDPDLHAGQAPPGLIQALTAVEAIGLLDEFVMHELSLRPGFDAEEVIDWLIEQESAARDRWPLERLVFHGRTSMRRSSDSLRRSQHARRPRRDEERRTSPFSSSRSPGRRRCLRSPVVVWRRLGLSAAL